MDILYDFFFFKQKTAYELRISDWTSDVCSSDLGHAVEICVHRRLQLVEQPFDLGVGRSPGQRIAKRLLRLTQGSRRNREPAVLDAQRRVPQELLHLGDGLLPAVDEAPRGGGQRQEYDEVVIVEILMPRDHTEPLDDLVGVLPRVIERLGDRKSTRLNSSH